MSEEDSARSEIFSGERHAGCHAGPAIGGFIAEFEENFTRRDILPADELSVHLDYNQSLASVVFRWQDGSGPRLLVEVKVYVQSEYQAWSVLLTSVPQPWAKRFKIEAPDFTGCDEIFDLIARTLKEMGYDD